MGRYQGEQFIDIEEVERFGSKNKELNPDSTPTREDTGGAPFVVQEIPSSGEVDFFEVSECIEELIHAENEEEVYVAVRDIPKEYIPRVIRALREELEVDFFVEANEDDSYERSALTDFEWEVQEHIEHQEFDDKDYFERIFFALEKIVYHSKKVEYGEIKDELYMLLERIAGARMIREISKTLSFIGGTEAARDCMNRLRTTDSVIIQEKYSRALYLLELGKIGVNSGVVNYLEQQYILKGDDEDNVDFARRITGDGKIGLFDERGGFVGYFELGDLITGDVEREAQILEISRDLLFSDPHTPDDIRQQFFADYTDFYEKVFGEIGGVRMSDLTLREQMWMYKYWKETDGDERWDKAVALKDEFGVDGVRTFIAAEFDPRVAGDVVFVSEQTKEHPERKAGLKAFFREYSSIISVAEDFYTSVFAALEENYPEVFDKKEFFSRLMRQAKDFLREVIQALLQNPDTRYQDILQQMRVEHRALDPRSCTEAVVAQATIEMINSIGDTETRAVLDEVHTSTDKPHVRQSIDLAYRFTIPSIDDADAIKSLEELYGNRIQFETYALNERMNDMEIKFLADRLSEDDQVCDLGFGTGRLLLPLREQGLKVRGLDYVTRHVDLVRQQVPDAEVFQADWKDTGLQGESQDVVYSLGRNILHEYTLAGQHALFAEVNRILPDGGQFIFDIPDRIRGHYKELVDGYAAVMKERGIENTRYGTIYDSPDGNIFMTRYAYSEMDILQLAEANGFAVESIERSELKTGSGDINMYFTLRKITDNLIDVHETPPLAMAA